MAGAWSRWSLALSEAGEGPLCLSLCNTLWWRNSKAPREQLHSYADVAKWAMANGIFDGDTARGIERTTGSAASAELEFARIVALREAVARLFSTLARGRPAGPDDLEVIQASFQEAASHLSLNLRDGRWLLSLDEGVNAVPVPRWQAALSAMGLVGSALRARVRQCADDRGCGWLFVDATRNGSRQFCQSRECGNRARQARFRERARLGSGHGS